MVDTKYDIKMITYICNLHDQGKSDREIVNRIGRKSKTTYKLASEMDMLGWNEIKRQVYEYTKNYILLTLFAPSIRDISNELMHSTSTVKIWIDRLIDEGWFIAQYCESGGKQARTLRLPLNEG